VPLPLLKANTAEDVDQLQDARRSDSGTRSGKASTANGIPVLFALISADPKVEAESGRLAQIEKEESPGRRPYSCMFEVSVAIV
jgi:hypothetical protein